MNLQYLLLLLVTFEAQAGNVEIEGEISIRLNDPNISPYKKHIKDRKSAIVADKLLLGDDNLVLRGYDIGKITVGPMVECMYQYPEEAQVQALLSNMMNELTKMFVRAHYMMYRDSRRKETRFRVVAQKQTDFFEDIYSNMTKQYLTFYNSSAVRVDRSGQKKDPCKNQEEMKELWKDLLDSSFMTFREAAIKCIDEHLKAKGDPENSVVREKLSQYLLRELSKVKMNQLTLLCDKFQLCYHDLIQRHDNSTFY